MDTFTFTGNVSNGDNQRTILIADTNGPIGADFTWTDLDLGQQLTAGAVCFDQGTPPDCIAWGLGFAGGDNLPSATEPFGADLPTSNSLTRDITRGCNTLLDASDDRDSGDDYSTTTPSPETNLVSLPANPCPNTQITKKPKAKTTDRTPKFEFTGGDGFECNLDSGGFEECDSPYEPGRLKRGKHTISVRATETDGSRDGTPANYAWKIVRNR